ncbi:uncharacterized protein LOC111398519 [Olea europaea subsp. europaea]|uniref:Uncharacterized protein LOC111398519 n=1 Tax=Olea europaea subsp. europaea TaxID=158383 RepID=A0A8S0RDN5_OLEEU|nr:uncharacterized protein LOC111398519 [Olea europaea subsp. europaea]
MTASANLSGRFIKDNNSNGTANGATSIDGALPENAVATFHPNSSASFEWSTDEQSILEDLLSKYSSDTIIVRYAKIAQQLNDKTVRDVALRCKWMTVSSLFLVGLITCNSWLQRQFVMFHII